MAIFDDDIYQNIASQNRDTRYSAITYRDIETIFNTGYRQNRKYSTFGGIQCTPTIRVGVVAANRHVMYATCKGTSLRLVN